MSAVPKTYRVYSFDAGRMAVTADFISAATDEAAIAEIRAAHRGSRCEIWDGKRLVAQLECSIGVRDDETSRRTGATAARPEAL